MLHITFDLCLNIVSDKSQLKNADDKDFSANDAHTTGTLRDMIHVAQTGSTIANLLNFPLPVTHAPTSSGIATESYAEAHTDGKVDFDGRCWALISSTDAMHSGHLDDKGLATEFKCIDGQKWTVVGHPKSDRDFGAGDAFGDKFDVDLTSGQDWRYFPVLLKHGDCL